MLKCVGGGKDDGGIVFKLKAIIISHWHRDHYNFLDVPLSEDMSLRKYLTQKKCAWIVPKTDKYKTIRTYNNTTSFQYPLDGAKRVFSIPVKLNNSDINGSSLVVHIDGVVYTGDINSGELDIEKGDPFRGIVLPHHGSVTGTSRQIRNQIIDKMDHNAARFVFVSNNNSTNCKPGIGAYTPKKIDGSASTQLETIGAESQQSNTFSTPVKRNVTKDKLSANFIFTSDDDDAIAQCVMFNSDVKQNSNAYRFMILRDNNVTTSSKQGVYILTQSGAENLKVDAGNVEDPSEY